MTESACDVQFDSDDCEPVQFYDERIVTARKAHVCTECGTEIAKGTRHRRMSYRFEDAFHVDRQCPLCQVIAGEFEHRQVGGMLWENFWNEWDEGARLQACLNRLDTADAKRHMHSQWLKWQAKRAEQQRVYAERKKVAVRTGEP